MGGTNETTSESSTDFLSPEQRRNIDAGLRNIYSAYQAGQGDFHGQGPRDLSGFTQQGMGALGAYGTAGPGAQFMQQGMGYLSGALGQQRPDLAAGVAGANQAIGGLGAGMDQLRATASGAYLDPYSNPAFTAGRDQMRTQFAEGVLPGIDSTFATAGRTGSGLRALQTGRAMEGLARAENELAGNIYQQERGRQDAAAQALQQGGFQGMGQLGNYYGQVGSDMRGAASMVPGMNQMGLGNAAAALDAGQIQDMYNERLRQFGIDRFNATNPYARAQRLMALSQGQYNQSGSQTMRQTYHPGAADIAGMIGGAGLSIAGLF